MKTVNTLPFRRGRMTQDGPMFDAEPGKEYRMVYGRGSDLLVAICCDDQHAEFVANACNAHDELVQDNNDLRDQVGQQDAELVRVRGEAAQLREVQVQLVAALKPLIEIADDHCDAGPVGEGWKSDELLAQINAAREAMVAAEAK